MLSAIGFESWWDSLTLARQIFYGIGILSLFALIIQVALTLFGVGHDDMPDAGGHSHDVSAISIK